MSLLGHSLSLSAFTLIVLTVHNFSQLCETKSTKDNSDLMYSDTSHGLQTAGAHQQVVFIDHGGGAISQIRRTSYLTNPSVPSLPFRPHVDHYPNTLYENNFADEPNVNFPEDISRIFERRDEPNTPNTVDIERYSPPAQPIPQPIPPQIHNGLHPIPQPIQPLLHNQPLIQHIQHNPISQPLAQPIPQQIPHHFQHQFPQPIQQPPYQHHIPQPNPQPMAPIIPHQMSQPLRNPIDSDIEDERFLINNEIERIPKPSNEMKPERREPPPPPPPPPPIQDQPISPFFNFGPELFQNFDSPFDPFSPQVSPLFQRRRLTTNNNNNNNNNLQDLNPNSIGYPSYTYYKGEENPALTNWPKIFKFTDGRSNLYEFEKQKKQNKIKFNSKENYFDHISRDSFLILHGGTFAQ